jgi:hypothetical protein
MKITRFSQRRFFASLFLSGILLTGCGSDITVCECLRDDGTHKKECDRLGNSMTDEEMSREINKCK